MSYQVNSYDLIPVGTVLSYAGFTQPNNWLVCDGTSYSITTYQNLFNVISNKYGGDGISTFCVPNLINRVIRGVEIDTTPQILGSDNITISTDNLPSHSHTYQDVAFIWGGGGGSTFNSATSANGTDNNQSLNINYRVQDSGGNYAGNPSFACPQEGPQPPNYDLYTGSVGSGSSISILPSCLTMTYIIKY